MTLMDQAGVVWSIPVSERQKYDQIFDGLQPVDGLLTGDKVKPVLLNSKLPVEVLGRVWELSDIDADGFLDREEFTLAMHLVYRALEKNPVPMVLPLDMIPPGKRKQQLPVSGLIPGAAPGPEVGVPVSAVMASGAGLGGGVKWVVSPADKIKYEEMFRQADSDGDGLVNGLQVKDVFLQSGLPQMTLAHIWNLCDTKMCGQLNSDQFALAMHLVQQKLVHGIDPPAQLTPEMLPPSLQLDSLPSTSGFNTTDTIGMKELDKLAAEIEQLKREKMNLEQDKTQKEADIRIRNGEVVALQKELDSMNSMVTQLGAQKEEAQKRLDELDDKRTKLENSISEIKEKYNEEQRLIKEFQNQILSRESIVTNQEVELKRMKEELDRLRQEESELELKLDTSRHQANALAKRVSDTQTEVNQTNKQVEELKELQKQLADSVKQYDDLLKGEITEDQLNPVPELSAIQLNQTQSLASSAFIMESTHSESSTSLATSKRSVSGGVSAFSNDADPFKTTALGGASDPFVGHSDPFGSGASGAFDVDPFSKKPDTAFSDPFGFDAGHKADPFGGDPFAETGMSSDTKSSSMLPPSETFSIGQDPWGAGTGGFDAFGFGSTSSADKIDNDLINSLDPFGTGSFGASGSSGESRGFKSQSPVVSSTPVLPPKQKKAPAPPRPPAPKPSHAESPSFRGTDSPQFSKQSELYRGGKITSEAEQLAWATIDSKKEYERLKRLQEQEQADLELAIALSKQP